MGHRAFTVKKTIPKLSDGHPTCTQIIWRHSANKVHQRMSTRACRITVQIIVFVSVFGSTIQQTCNTFYAKVLLIIRLVLFANFVSFTNMVHKIWFTQVHPAPDIWQSRRLDIVWNPSLSWQVLQKHELLIACTDWSMCCAVVTRVIKWCSECMTCYSMAYSPSTNECQVYIPDDRQRDWQFALEQDANFNIWQYVENWWKTAIW